MAATVHWPGLEANRSRYSFLRGIPFIIHNDDYPDGINAYIFDRVRGRISHQHGGSAVLSPKRHGYHSAKRIAHDLSDFLTWAATAGAHPSLGGILWKDVKAWHITDLYQDALSQGFWTQDFWQGNPRPLAPETVGSRVNEALRCYRWLADNGYIDSFDYEPEMITVQKSKDDALLSFRNELREIRQTGTAGRPKPIRTAPGDKPLPSIEHLQEFFAAITGRAHRLAAMHMFETGLRADELVENTLLPGHRHVRINDGRRNWHPEWPVDEYLLRYALDDKKMLGVIPPKDLLVPGADRKGYQLDCMILGKGPKIRKVSLSPTLLRSLWAYADTERLRVSNAAKPSAHLLLNRFGEKLSYHAIWEAFQAANDRVNAPLSITPHMLRRAHACYFLEAGLRAKAKLHNHGDDLTSLPFEFLQQEGNVILMIIKNNLGHSEFETTKQYLEQIISGRLGRGFHDAWQNFLGGEDE